MRAKLSLVPGFTLKAIAEWGKIHLAPGSTVLSDGLACFNAVSEAGFDHQPTVIDGRKPKELPEFRWVNTVLPNLKTSLSGCGHALAFRKYGDQYLAAFTYRFNRRFDLSTLNERLLIAAATCGARSVSVIFDEFLHQFTHRSRSNHLRCVGVNRALSTCHMSATSPLRFANRSPPSAAHQSQSRVFRYGQSRPPFSCYCERHCHLPFDLSHPFNTVSFFRQSHDSGLERRNIPCPHFSQKD